MKKITKKDKGALVDVTIAVTVAAGEVTRICANPQHDRGNALEYPTTRVAISWRSLPGAKSLTQSGFGITDAQPCLSTGPCIRHFTIPAAVHYGTVVPVVSVSIRYLAKAPTNNLGGAGFEKPIAMRVARSRHPEPEPFRAGGGLQRVRADGAARTRAGSDGAAWDPDRHPAPPSPPNGI